jgi:cytochrome c-type biogenesis protein CcmH/NrfG
MKGHALSSLGDHDQAVSAYQEALKLAPEDPYVRHLVVAATAMPGSKRAPEELSAPFSMAMRTASKTI